MTTWTLSTEQLPELKEDPDRCWPTARVLGCCESGCIRVVLLEQIDEDEPPRWFSGCSEHWSLDDSEVMYWMPLPELPVALRDNKPTT